jgi:hypothetical protein
MRKSYPSDIARDACAEMETELLAVTKAVRPCVAHPSSAPAGAPSPARGEGKAAASGEGKLRVGARLDEPRGGVIWLIHGFSTIILTIAKN